VKEILAVSSPPSPPTMPLSAVGSSPRSFWASPEHHPMPSSLALCWCRAFGPVRRSSPMGANIVYTFIFGLILATILMLPVGLLIGRFAYGAIVRAPKSALVPVVAFMTVIGTFSIRNSISDIAIMVILGIVGWVATKRGFSVSPIVLGLILGRIAEQGFVQSWTIGDAIGDLWGQFFGRPLSMVIIAMTLVSFIYPFLPQMRRLVMRTSLEPIVDRTHAPASAILRDLVSLAVFGLIGAVVVMQSASLNADAAVFPRTVAWGMLAFVAIAIIKLLITRDVVEETVAGSTVRRIAVPAIMLGAVAMISTLGFGLSGLLMGIALMLVAQHGKAPGRFWALLTLGVIATILLFTFSFRNLLSVPLPTGLFL
jgi:putative tricarboxylic transport membrane protein